MSSMETINEGLPSPAQTPAESAQKQAKQLFIGFAATVTIGLALAGWYVGGRIFAAEKAHPVAIAKPVSSAPLIAEPVAAVVVDKPAAETPAWNTVEPQAGQLYLQLATMGPNSTNDYLKVLDAKGIHPGVAPGPSDSLHRLVIGPYPDKAALEQQQQQLEAAGIQFIARRY